MRIRPQYPKLANIFCLRTREEQRPSLTWSKERPFSTRSSSANYKTQVQDTMQLLPNSGSMMETSITKSDEVREVQMDGTTSARRSIKSDVINALYYYK